MGGNTEKPGVFGGRFFSRNNNVAANGYGGSAYTGNY
jgi:hypothetical protein